MRSSIDSVNPYTPISVISFGSKSWKIKARVVELSNVNSFINKRSNTPGKILNAILMDVEGDQINALFWNTAADYASTKLEKSKTYIFSNGRVALSNKRFSTNTSHNYDIIFDGVDSCCIEKTNDDTDIPEERVIIYSTLRSIHFSNKQLPYMTNLRGVIISSNGIRQITSRNDEQLKVLNITILDATEYSINVAIWGEASEFDFNIGDIICIINCQIREGRFGKVANSVRTSEIIINPNTNEAEELRIWYSNNDSSTVINNISGNFDQRNQKTFEIMTIKEIIELINGSIPEDVLIVQTYAYITDIIYKSVVNGESNYNITYKACTKCNKKFMTEDYCTYCDNTEWTYKMSTTLVLCDFTASQLYVRSFNDVLQEYLRCSPNHIEAIKDNPTEIALLFNYISIWNQCKLTLRIRKDYFNGQLRNNISVQSISSITDDQICLHYANKINEINQDIFNEFNQSYNHNIENYKKQRKITS